MISFAERDRQALTNVVPALAVERLLSQFGEKQVQVYVVAPRKSKLGDYRPPQRGVKIHIITVNGNLPAQFFLLVLLHELAHMQVFIQYQSRVQPHGHEWQQCYSSLIVQYIDCFDSQAQQYLRRYTARIPLYRPAMQQLEQYFRQQVSGGGSHSLTLNEWPLGKPFRPRVRPQMVLIANEKMRTRFRCTEPSTGAKYIVSGTMEVAPA